MPNLEAADVNILRRLTGVDLGHLAPTSPMPTDDVPAGIPNMTLGDVAERLSLLEKSGYVTRYHSAFKDGWVLAGRGVAERDAR